MLPTIFLSKVLGVFLIMLGAVIMLRRHYFIPVFAAYVRERLIRTVASLLELLIGLFLALNNDWSPLPAAVITLIGWMVVAEGLVYLLFPDEYVEKLIRTFNTSFWYTIGGLLAIVVGTYLAAYGFGFIGRSL
jgi:hypothetical protein